MTAFLNKVLAGGFRAIGLSILVVLASTAGWSQTTAGSVTGTVHDSSGAVVANAQVRLINTLTGVVQRTASSQTGDYQFLIVPPGEYAVEVESDGFKTFRREGVIVEVNRSLAVPATLAVGAVTETVEVKE